jgi:hypothetical protein
MNKYKETFGVDISKDVFDVHGSGSGHNQFKNDEKGFASFLKILPEGALVANGGYGLLPLQARTVSLQEQRCGFGGKSLVRKTFHPDEACQGKDGQERCQGNLPVCPGQ